MNEKVDSILPTANMNEKVDSIGGVTDRYMQIVVKYLSKEKKKKTIRLLPKWKNQFNDYIIR